MRVKVIGKRNVSFTAQDGNQINGNTVYYLYHDSNVDGACPDKTFVRSNVRDPFEINKEYEVYFMRNGKIDLDSVKEC